MSVRNRFAVSRDLSCSTAMLISPRLRVSRHASDPLPYFKDTNARENTTWAFWCVIRLARLKGRDGAAAPAIHAGVRGRV